MQDKQGYKSHQLPHKAGKSHHDASFQNEDSQPDAQYCPSYHYKNYLHIKHHDRHSEGVHKDASLKILRRL